MDSTFALDSCSAGLDQLAIISGELNRCGHVVFGILSRLDEGHIPYSIHGTPGAGSIYVRDPDEILVELTTGY
jgi:catechol 2,3-dioxygenase-like lactoylglutathione lyase family enzyme